ncbi:rfaE bifunctional protein kinase chain/domain [Caldicoprobacter guelmensis]|uniref:bifunctional heptose 7-phosphate kinase/heptose 1-phosphate adenyltransferase n=1 Tax=Caldicoprobacter guelmensis TaxID=1170224 RepID=UPI0019594F3D|nr:PfkB family carbohydrate kinase [Caldicoprobacter guelmensis]MBM7581486.1 rfaE bifunctional protein kinase chain/domain [Caldicoprobacter guelmensis]
MVDIYGGFSFARLEHLLNAISSIKVAVVGDACLDVYWEADMTLSELSRETPHFPLPVVEERMSGGAGANTAQDFAALGVNSVMLISVIGRDWRADQLLKVLHEAGVSTEHILSSPAWITPAYCKPRRHGISEVVYEDPRIDFENRKPLPEDVEAGLIERLREVAPLVDVIAVVDQLKYGVITEKVIHEVERLAAQGKVVVVDSRMRIGRYKRVIVKPNEVEAIRAVEPHLDPRGCNKEDWYRVARKLSERVGGPVLMTVGDKGAVWVDEGSITEIPTKPVEPPIDIVGAGDAFMSAFCAALAAGATGPEAAYLGNLAAAITVRKIGITGTASPEEIKQRYMEVHL